MDEQHSELVLEDKHCLGLCAGLGGTDLKLLVKKSAFQLGHNITMTTMKSVKLFNLEERKTQTGSITEVDIFQWKNTLLDNLKKETEFNEHCTETSKWDTERVTTRGFVDTVADDGLGKKKSDQVTSMLTKIASYAPKSIVREIVKRTKCLADIWNIARDWAGIQSSGSKHLEYYKIKMSYRKVDKEETKQEFYYRLRDAMEDTLIMAKDKIHDDDGELIVEDEDMTPTVKSTVVLDWLEAIGGPSLIEHVHRLYAKELESVTLSSLQSRIWKNIDSLMREIEGSDGNDAQKVYRVEEATCRQVGRGRGIERGGRGQSGSSRFHQQDRQGGGTFSKRGGFRGTFSGYSRGGFRGSPSGSSGDKFCKLCKASGSQNFKSHDISECWLLSERDRSNILKASAKAQALFAFEEECTIQDNYDDEDLNEEEEEDDERNYD